MESVAQESLVPKYSGTSAIIACKTAALRLSSLLIVVKLLLALLGKLKLLPTRKSVHCLKGKRVGTGFATVESVVLH